MKSLLKLASIINNPIINLYGSLDEIAAEKLFADKNYEEAMTIFRSNEVWMCGHLMWMADPGFIYYFCAFLDVLGEKIGDFEDAFFADRVAQLMLILEFRGREFTEISYDYEAVVRCRLEQIECSLMKSTDEDAERLLIKIRKVLNNWPTSMGGGFTLE